ncbi:hypothetical protein PR202_gb22881 [Eleusine coracana subsp. coracana]|uniref:Polycomb protein VEFS-Box domain-containing protein n=1 Tax=Eleusine coracana subsp. coracana TaxID=191504 RepID=A0AAV5FHH3_ELECO|nr:hypothetical protein PR202_gb22881 [Eleusine coracana subsp. coracana]
MSLSPYNNSSYNDVPPSSLPNIISLRDGNVVFNYKYYNNMMEKTEGSSLKIFVAHFVWYGVEASRYQNYARLLMLVRRLMSGELSSKLKMRRRLKITIEETKHANPDITTSGSPKDVQATAEDDNVQGENGIVGLSSIDPAHTLCGTSLSQPTVLQFGKTRKLSVNRADPRNQQLLQKRQFFHSHRAQPMASEQLFSDCDSEDEIDDDIADLEDRRMLDEFVDVTKDEKLIMHMWNSFVRKQRVLADRHVPWACEAFSRFHGKQLVQNPPLLWSWRFFMIKLWNHGLLDARTMNTCNIILQGIQDEGSDPKQP